MRSSVYYPPQNRVAGILEEDFPFDVWADKVHRLRPSLRKKQCPYLAAESALFLADHYMTILVASLQNPMFRWLAIERFTFSNTLKQTCDTIANKAIDKSWRAIFGRKGFIAIERTTDLESNPSDVEIWSSVLGNPGEVRNGTLHLRYEPEAHLAMIREVARFRVRSLPILNSFKHGYRLPRATRQSFRQLLESLPGNHQIDDGALQSVEDAFRQRKLPPAFWLLSTGKQRVERGSRRIPAELRLVGVNPAGCARASTAILDLLRLLFDSSREDARLDRWLGKSSPDLFGHSVDVLASLHFTMREATRDATSAGLVRSYTAD